MKYKFIALILPILSAIIISSNVLAAGSAALSWRENNEPDLAGYKIYYGLSPRTGDCPPGGYTNNVDVGRVTSYTFTDLSYGQTYYFSLVAYDIYHNESCFSAEINKAIAEKKLSWYEAIGRFFQQIFSPLSVLFPKIF